MSAIRVWFHNCISKKNRCQEKKLLKCYRFVAIHTRKSQATKVNIICYLFSIAGQKFTSTGCLQCTPTSFGGLGPSIQKYRMWVRSKLQTPYSHLRAALSIWTQSFKLLQCDHSHSNRLTKAGNSAKIFSKKLILSSQKLLNRMQANLTNKDATLFHKKIYCDSYHSALAAQFSYNQ